MRPLNFFRTWPALVALCLLSAGCPSAKSFNLYIVNFSNYNMIEFKLHDASAGGELVNVLDAPIPGNTMRIVQLDSARFAAGVNEVVLQLDDGGIALTVVSNMSNAAGHIGFSARAADTGSTASSFVVQDGAKSDLASFANNNPAH